MKEIIIPNVIFPTFEGDLLEGVDLCISRWKSEVGSCVHGLSGSPLRLPDRDTRLLALPAAIDAHVHFREPGFEHKETIKTGSTAALHGGVLAVLDMPNTSPPTLTPDDVLYKKNLAVLGSRVQFHVAAGITDSNLSLIPQLYRSADAFKAYLAESFGKTTLSMQNLPKALSILEEFTPSRPLFLHAELPELLLNDPSLPHHLARPEKAEVECIRQVLEIAENFSAWIHITHVSSATALNLLLRHSSSHVTFDVTPRAMLLTAEQWDTLGPLMKVNPPIRPSSNSIALQRAFLKKQIPMVASDHSPHTLSEKASSSPPSGAPGVQELLITIVDFLLRENPSKLSLLSQILTVMPAKLLGISAQKWLEQGNFVLIDPTQSTSVTREWIKTKVGWSLWQHNTLQGKVTAVFKRGLLVAGSLPS